MSTDYAEMERDFVASLKEDTGRDLAGWMTAIKESDHSERNAIIDWLRHQGFQFSRASWLERIHHNGGRLIYAGDFGHAFPPGRAKPPDTTERLPRAFEPAPRPPMEQSAPKLAPSNYDVELLLADAKGLRPLADFVLREITRTVPHVEFAADGSFITMRAPQIFAALLPSPKALRLYGNFGTAGVHRSKPADAVNRSASTFPEVLVLDDARSIDEDFLRLIRAAARL